MNLDLDGPRARRPSGVAMIWTIAAQERSSTPLCRSPSLMLDLTQRSAFRPFLPSRTVVPVLPDIMFALACPLMSQPVRTPHVTVTPRWGQP